MSTTRVSEAVARPARTVVQAVPSIVITEFVDAFITNLNDKQYAALAGLLLLVFGFLQVLVENKVGYALFRKFTYTNPAVVSTPTTPLADGENNLPTKVAEAQPDATVMGQP